MAIIIPSKYIFGDPANEKVRKNVITSLDLEYKNVTEVTQVDVPVHSTTMIPSNEAKAEYSKFFLDNFAEAGPFPSTIIVYSVATVYTAALPFYSDFTVRFPKVENNRLAKDVEEDDVSFSITFDVQEYKATATSTGETIDNPSVIDMNVEYVKTTTQSLSKVDTKVENILTDVGILWEGIDGSITLDDITTISIQDDSNYYIVTIKNLLTGIEYFTLQTNVFTLSMADGKLIDGPYSQPMNGKRMVYIPKSVVITVNGTTIGIELEDKVYKLKDGKKPYSISSSDFLQNATTISGELATSKISSEVLQQYGKGKETIELECAIADYYHENGVKAISTDGTLPMVFENGNIVSPRKYSGGKDVPFSENLDGSAKDFSVVSAEVYYDGRVMQKLYLLET